MPPIACPHPCNNALTDSTHLQQAQEAPSCLLHPRHILGGEAASAGRPAAPQGGKGAPKEQALGAVAKARRALPSGCATTTIHSLPTRPHLNNRG